MARSPVGQVQALGDNPIKGCLAAVEPLFGLAQVTGDRRQRETIGEGFNVPSIVVATVGAVLLLAIFGGTRSRTWP
jgi:hypothetical protein